MTDKGGMKKSAARGVALRGCGYLVMLPIGIVLIIVIVIVTLILSIIPFMLFNLNMGPWLSIGLWLGLWFALLFISTKPLIRLVRNRQQRLRGCMIFAKNVPGLSG